jgi:hypothetical protein
MEEPENSTGEKSFKKKKKFVYLDKFETYKEVTDEKIRLMQRSINICYLALAVQAAAIVILALK